MSNEPVDEDKPIGQSTLELLEAGGVLIVGLERPSDMAAVVRQLNSEGLIAFDASVILNSKTGGIVMMQKTSDFELVVAQDKGERGIEFEVIGGMSASDCVH